MDTQGCQSDPCHYLLSSRANHARARRQSRMTVWGDTPNASAASSTLNPPKNRNSTTFALRGSSRSNSSSASSRAQNNAAARERSMRSRSRPVVSPQPAFRWRLCRELPSIPDSAVQPSQRRSTALSFTAQLQPLDCDSSSGSIARASRLQGSRHIKPGSVLSIHLEVVTDGHPSFPSLTDLVQILFVRKAGLCSGAVIQNQKSGFRLARNFGQL